MGTIALKDILVGREDKVVKAAKQEALSANAQEAQYLAVTDDVVMAATVVEVHHMSVYLRSLLFLNNPRGQHLGRGLILCPQVAPSN